MDGLLKESVQLDFRIPIPPYLHLWITNGTQIELTNSCKITELLIMVLDNKKVKGETIM